MSSIQQSTRKIRKISRRNSSDARTFVCGACLKDYKFYASLYLHIRRKHDGVRPPGTIVETTSVLGPKLPIEVIVQKITEVSQQKSDKSLKDLQEYSVDFLLEHAESDLKMRILDIEEDFVHLNPSKGSK